ncbi:MAG TPA: sugar phosphate isomerase/epimerase [Capsulimonadaceae bacterium]|jgi:sugar phosphate isomerase/epimerase
MTDIKSAVGVQSYCFRGFKDNAKVASLVREIGVAAIELCGVHADFNAPATWDEVIATYKNAGVEIVSIGVQGFNGDEAKERQWFEFAKLAGAKYISAHFSLDTIPGAFRVAEKLSAEFGIKVAIHNHGGYQWHGSADALDWILRSTRDSIGLNIDTAWALDARENPVKLVERFGPRVYGLHIKDFTFDRARKSSDVIVGTGNLDLPGLLAAAKAVNFDGFAVIEYEGDVENPVPALAECVKMVKNA